MNAVYVRTTRNESAGSVGVSRCRDADKNEGTKKSVLATSEFILRINQPRISQRPLSKKPSMSGLVGVDGDVESGYLETVRGCPG